MSIINITGQGHLAPHGKKLVAASMYAKGKAFIGAAVLLQQQSTLERGNMEHIDYVILHLLCQGIEVILKGLLLIHDYDRFKVRLRKPLGHNLYKITKEALRAYRLKPLRSNLDSELQILSKLYSKHLLRYGSGYDILVDPHSIPREQVFRRIAAVIRLAERELSRG